MLNIIKNGIKSKTFSKKFFVILIFILALLLKPVAYAEPPNPTKTQPAKISGTFIQYQNWMMQLNRQKWISELESMKQSGIDTIVIQWLKSDRDRFYPVHVKTVDPTEIILQYADQHHMQVHLGLQFDKTWWNKWDNRMYLKGLAEDCHRFSKALWKRYGKHPSFSGWYLPYEMSDSDWDEDEIAGLRQFLKSVTSPLRKLTRKKYPIGFSVFFQGKIPPQAVESIYTELLKGSGIDLLMIQDGVGVQNWNTNMRDKVGPYLSAYQKAAEKNRIRVWNIVEGFSIARDTTNGSTLRTPADIQRLNEQLLIQAEHPSDKVLVFDFFHYLSPHRGEKQKLLLEKYQELVQSQ